MNDEIRALLFAQEDTCSLHCPSVWKTGQSQPHSERCAAVRAAVARVSLPTASDAGASPVEETQVVSRLRAALAGLIGAESKEDLQAIEAAMQLVPAPDADKAVMLNAIRALLDD